MKELIEHPEVITTNFLPKIGLFEIEVCVPVIWTDEAILSFANMTEPSHTINGWKIKNKKTEVCADNVDYLHIVLVAN